ncbi:MAG: glycerophosphodiester phosphodiesterase family protein [Acidobacteriota bacterium]
MGTENIKIVGHRGAAGYAPENTLLSFQAAMDAGCDKVEMDVRVTKDGHAVVIHDATLNRTTNGKGPVLKKTLEELRKLECGRGQKIPAFREVVDLCKNRIRLIVELKEFGASKAVSEILEEKESTSSSLVISFDAGMVREMKETNPKIKLGLLFKKPLFKDKLEHIWKVVEEVPLDYICARSDSLNRKMVSEAHAKGLKVFAYNVNSKDIFRKMAECGVDEICTDYPKLFTHS